jgi:hypothetical protein
VTYRPVTNLGSITLPCMPKVNTALEPMKVGLAIRYQVSRTDLQQCRVTIACGTCVVSRVPTCAFAFAFALCLVPSVLKAVTHATQYVFYSRECDYQLQM